MPDSVTTLLCGGYTTAGFLGIGADSIPTKISLTNYSATLRNTLIQSQAMLHQALDVNNVKRTKNAFIWKRDGSKKRKRISTLPLISHNNDQHSAEHGHRWPIGSVLLL